MIFSIDIEDDRWRTVEDLEALARQVAGHCAEHFEQQGEIAVLLSNDIRIADLNARWRNKSGPTNVLSFPAPAGGPLPAGMLRPLGDVVLAYETVAREACEQEKTLRDHTAHLLVHGALHL